ncbi:MAG: VanZ family protein [Porticoccaceae bacterium]|jgi:VanZ family protein|nr:VanZ family protein [Porticoccaceae bacterium]
MTLLIKTLFWLACTAVTAASLAPTEYLPPVFNWWDKAQHTLAFLVLGLMGYWAYGQKNRTWILVGLLALGGLIEIAQAATGWRYGDLADLLADGVGLLLAALLIWIKSTLQA